MFILFEYVSVIIGQARPSERDGVELVVFQSDRWMLFLRGAVLMEDVFDVFGAIGMKAEGLSDGCDQQVGSVLVV